MITDIAPPNTGSPRELLDNRCFAVNQRGGESYPIIYSSYTPIYDRWLAAGTGVATVIGNYHLLPGYSDARLLAFSGGTTNVVLSQVIGPVADGFVTIDANQYTGSIWVYADQDSTIMTQEGLYTFSVSAFTWTLLCWPMPAGAVSYLVNMVTPGVYHVAQPRCVEGLYTVESLPRYVPRPYAVELSECQRYFTRYDGIISTCWPDSATAIRAWLPVVGMRVTPTIASATIDWIMYANNGYVQSPTYSSAVIQSSSSSGVLIKFDGLPANLDVLTRPILINLRSTFSADL